MDAESGDGVVVIHWLNFLGQALNSQGQGRQYCKGKGKCIYIAHFL